MNNIENTYTNYDELVSTLTADVIESRIQQISQEMLDFLEINNLKSVAYIHEMALTHAIMDYFTDIQRLKNYQKIEHINEIKIKAYETFWLLKRKPLQLTSFMLDSNINTPITGEKSIAFKNFLDTLYYYMKFRQCDAQSIELMLLAFKAGQLVCI